MKNKIDVYIDEILQSVLHIEKHQDIRDELEDHLFTQIEEKMDHGMEEEDAIIQAFSVMGKPKNLAKQFNSVYRVGKMPLVSWIGGNLFYLIFIAHLLLNINIMKTLDIVSIVVAIFISSLGLYSSFKQIYYLNDMKNHWVYYASGAGKTYTQKLIYKFVVVSLLVFIPYFSYGLFRVIQKDVLRHLIQNNGHFSLLTLGIWANYAFSYIASYTYPSMILTEQGIYRLGDLPRKISWERIQGHQWNRILGEYHLSLLGKKPSKKIKIPTHLGVTDKIIIDNLFEMKHRNS